MHSRRHGVPVRQNHGPHLQTRRSPSSAVRCMPQVRRRTPLTEGSGQTDWCSPYSPLSHMVMLQLWSESFQSCGLYPHLRCCYLINTSAIRPSGFRIVSFASATMFAALGLVGVNVKFNSVANSGSGPAEGGGCTMVGFPLIISAGVSSTGGIGGVALLCTFHWARGDSPVPFTVSATCDAPAAEVIVAVSKTGPGLRPSFVPR